MISPSFWLGRRVLLTGHTGFKGAWTALALRTVGAQVYGLALAPVAARGVFTVAEVQRDVHNRFGDVRSAAMVQEAFCEALPQVVIHMAAQSLVRASYADPAGTYATNVMGTVNILECVRQSPSVQAVVIVTSDKCYANVECAAGYREDDALGGHDPYSGSKACAELVTDSYRKSFFFAPEAPAIASARAGNAIGGGDWGEDRLVPDAMRAFMGKVPLTVRHPHAVRPWQHVLDPVLAYLRLAERLSTEGHDFAEAWNFGPRSDNEITVAAICERLAQRWGGAATWTAAPGEHAVEAAVLNLDCSKAAARLNWQPVLSLDRAIALTVEWYKALQDDRDMRAVTLAQIEEVLDAAACADRQPEQQIAPVTVHDP